MCFHSTVLRPTRGHMAVHVTMLMYCEVDDSYLDWMKCAGLKSIDESEKTLVCGS